MTDRHGVAFVRGSLRDENETQRGGRKTKESDKFFEEGVDYFLRGYVYHPNLIDWDAQFRLGLAQQRIRINDERFDSNGDLLGYALSALLLQQKPLSVRVSASDNKDFLERSFARTNEYRTQRQAIEIISRYLVSANLLWENLDTHEISDQRETTRHTQRLRLSAVERTNPDLFTSLTFEHENTSETSVFTPIVGLPVVQDLPVNRDELNISHVWRFGPEDLKSGLTGRLRYLNRGGFFPNDIITVEERLDLAHTPTFSTYYRGLYDNNRTDTETDRVALAEAGFPKKIYGSLDLGGRVNVVKRDFGTGSEDTTGAYLTADYRKHTALGLYQSTLLLGREREDEASAAGVRPVIDEAVTLSGIAFVPLNEPSVLPGTVRVTTADRTFAYREGIDYQLHTIGAVTEIARLAGGLIADPETVLVSYSTTAALSATFNRTLVRWTNRLGLKSLPLWLYFEYHLRDEELTSGEDPGNLDRVARTLLGVELRHNGWTAAAEHEQRDERLSPPSTADRLRVRYQQRLSPEMDVSFGGRLERTSYSQGQKFGLAHGRDRLDVLSAFGRLSARVRRDVLLLVEADYFRSSGQENDELARVGLGLQGSYHSLDFSVLARHSIFQQEFTDGTRDTLTFNVSRRF